MYIQLEELASREMVPGFNAKFIHSQGMTLAYWEIEAGAELPAHSHHHEQVANILEGEFELRIGGSSQILGPGSVAVIPSHASHSGRAVTSCRILDCFSPVRMDYMFSDGSSAQAS